MRGTIIKTGQILAISYTLTASLLDFQATDLSLRPELAS